MKYLIIAILSALVSFSVAADTNFELDVIRGSKGEPKIIYNGDEWVKVTSAAAYDVYVPRVILADKGKEAYRFFGMTVFNKEESFSIIPVPVKKIYSFGILKCKESRLYLAGDFFTDSNDIIVHSQEHDWGTYITDMGVPNTIRNDVYNAVCKESI